MSSTHNAGVKLFNIRQIVVVGVLTAITVVLGQFGWGFLVIPGLPAKITIMHIPVIIGAIIEGPMVGAMVGLLFGIFSMIQNMMVPTALSFAFLNPLVSVVPRILIGLASYYTYRAIRLKSDTLRIGIAAAAGTATNTAGVLGMIYLLYAVPFAKVIKVDVNTVGKAIAGIAITNGIPEVIAAVILTVAVVSSVKRIIKR